MDRFPFGHDRREHRDRPDLPDGSTRQALLVVAALLTTSLFGLPTVASGTAVPSSVDPSTGAAASPPSSRLTGSDQVAGVVTAVVRDIAPAVVTIDAVIGGVTSGQGGLAGPTGRAVGSGVVIDPDGLILTNRHVAGDASSLTVTLADGRRFPGRTVGVDTLTDFAFVRIDGADLPTAPLGDSSSVQVGQPAIAIGDPLGEFPGTVTTGVISGLDRSIQVTDEVSGELTTLRHLIQTDASINPGNSGGPLVDTAGTIVGIDTAASGVAQGIGFALPIDLAKPIIDQVRRGQPIQRPYLGIVYEDVDARVAADANLPVTSGAWVHADPVSGRAAVVEGGPAAAAGIREGDIITALGGETVDRDHQLDLLLLKHGPGETVTVTILRDGTAQDVQVTLGTRPSGV